MMPWEFFFTPAARVIRLAAQLPRRGTSSRTTVRTGSRYGIEDDSSGTLVEGNYVGTDITGSVALGNVGGGIFVAASGNTIGGASSGAGNLVSGNVASGVFIYLTSETLVQGNLIGTNASGTSALGNSGTGIYVYDSSDNTIGGTVAGEGNLISRNNGDGLDLGLSSNDNLVEGTTSAPT